MKTCPNCKTLYLSMEENFYKDKSRKSGYGGWCKKCNGEYSKEYNKQYKKNNGENYINKWQRENTDKTSKYQRKWRHKNIVIVRKKANCRYITKKILKKQKINRHKQYCEICGKPAIIHHNNYDDPTDISFLCPHHHRKLHKKLNKKNACQKNNN